MFPIYIKFNRLIAFDHPKAEDWIVKLIVKKLENLKVDKIKVIDNHIDFKNSLFNALSQSKMHLMYPVNQGYFDYNISTSTIIYKFSTLPFFIFFCILSCLFGLLNSSVFIGLFLFFLLYGMNWIIVFIRHGRFFNNIIEEIKSKNYQISN